MSLGVYSLVKNEAPWIGYSVLSMKDWVSEWVYFDGGSTDGTLELLAYLKDHYKLNIRVFKDKDPKDLKGDYTRLFDECLQTLTTEYAFFAHPDMIAMSGPSNIRNGLAYSVGMRSFAGEPTETCLEIVEGRGKAWKNIHKKTLGLHYHGHYGAADEDMYFRDITGSQHHVYADFRNYPYAIEQSGIWLYHYSDVRPYGRRLQRMVRCLLNQGYDEAAAKEAAIAHPRVIFKPNAKWGDFKFVPQAPLDRSLIFDKHAEEFASVLCRPTDEVLWIPLKSEVRCA